MITIRKATFEDCPVIQRIARIAFPATYASILNKEQLDYMMEWMYSTESLHRQMTDEGHIYYLAFADKDEAVGYVSIQQESDHLFHLQKLYVLPDQQGRHIGELLFKQAVSAIKALHPSPCMMELNVNRSNRALGFYQRMGMEKAREGDFPIGHGFYMNDYIMRLEL